MCLSQNVAQGGPMQFLPDLFLILQPFSDQMSQPVFSNLPSILSGWILSRRHTVSAALTADAPLSRHFCSYYRVFSNSVWNVDAAGLGLARLILSLSTVIPGVRVTLVVDDTLCKKKGRLPFGVGMHYDASATGRGLSNSHGSYKANGHCWVILGLGVELAFRKGHLYCLPILARLYHNHKSAERHKITCQTKVQLAVQMIKLVTDAFADRQFDLLSDSAYAGKNMLGVLPANCHLTCRWILNAALYEPLQTCADKKPQGRPRVHGKRLPGVGEMIEKPGRRIELDVYGKHQTLLVWQTFACFYATPKIALNIVITQTLDASGKPDPDSTAILFSTNTALTPQQVIELYARRWTIKVTIHDTKQQLGIAQPQVWSRKSVERAVPTMLMMYTAVVAWFSLEGCKDWRPTILPWYTHKSQPSFADMLGHLRIQLLNEQIGGIFKNHHKQMVPKKALSKLAVLIKQAA
jgi:DDE superfamily endonuclease